MVMDSFYFHIFSALDAYLCVHVCACMCVCARARVICSTFYNLLFSCIVFFTFTTSYISYLCRHKTVLGSLCPIKKSGVRYFKVVSVHLFLFIYLLL